MVTVLSTIRLRTAWAGIGFSPQNLPEMPMPKIPDLSAAAVKNREALRKKAVKPKEAPVAAPKPRIAKGR
jgi:hypothetical protein